MTDSPLRFDEVHFRHVHRRRGDVEVLRELSFALSPRDRVALVGRSGSGKSTVLALASGRLTATSGTVSVAGADLGAMTVDERARVRLSQISHVHQDFRLLPRYSARENVELPLLLQGVSRAEARDRATRALERVGLATRADHRTTELSGGEQQRVAIARAVVRSPTLLLADEPTGALDVGLRDEILALLFETCAEAAILLVTHDPAVAGAAGRTLELPRLVNVAGAHPAR